MVSRQIFECKTCGTRIMLRTQATALSEHFINIYCGNCNTLISGKAVFNPENATIDIKLDNAVPADEKYPLFEMELSADFITNKPTKRNSSDEVQRISPFMRSFASMGSDVIMKFEERISHFMCLKNTGWGDLKRINGLWLNGKKEYLERELGNYLPKEQFPSNNDLEYLRGIHQLNLIFIQDILKKDYFEESAFVLMKEIGNLFKMNSEKSIEMVKYFSENGLLLEYEKKIFDITSKFVDIFEQVMPAVSL